MRDGIGAGTVFAGERYQVTAHGYGYPLRAIGQALEVLNLAEFSVEPDDHGFRVTGAVVADAKASSNGARRVVFAKGSAAKANVAVLPSAMRTLLTPLALRYSPADIERLEHEGLAQRSVARRSMESGRLSQALRDIGAYLDQKYSRLLRLSFTGENFEVFYESSLGSQFNERFTAAQLYDLSVRFYLQRSARSV